MKELTKDILYMIWCFFGVLLIGVPAMLTWSGVFISWSCIYSEKTIGIIGISIFPIIILTKLISDKYFPLK